MPPRETCPPRTLELGASTSTVGSATITATPGVAVNRADHAVLLQLADLNYTFNAYKTGRAEGIGLHAFRISADINIFEGTKLVKTCTYPSSHPPTPDTTCSVEVPFLPIGTTAFTSDIGVRGAVPFHSLAVVSASTNVTRTISKSGGPPLCKPGFPSPCR